MNLFLRLTIIVIINHVSLTLRHRLVAASAIVFRRIDGLFCRVQRNVTRATSQRSFVKFVEFVVIAQLAFNFEGADLPDARIALSGRILDGRAENAGEIMSQKVTN